MNGNNNDNNYGSMNDNADADADADAGDDIRACPMSKYYLSYISPDGKECVEFYFEDNASFNSGIDSIGNIDSAQKIIDSKALPGVLCVDRDEKHPHFLAQFVPYDSSPLAGACKVKVYNQDLVHG